MRKLEDRLRLRAHHVCCQRFLTLGEERGEAYDKRVREIDDALASDDRIIEVAEGIDVLCDVCPVRSGNACGSPKGGDVGVRKWDAVLVRELGVPFGTAMTAGEWRRLIAQKTPFQLCSRCGYTSRCTRGLTARGEQCP